jgi:quercetin dioxygenase-like cupin family protein
MPESAIIPNSSKAGDSTIKGAKTFTGEVWLDAIHMAEDVSIANVMFTPCARTYWHTHEKGQLIKVTAGSGWVCDKGGKPRRIKVGDVIWASAGTTHWHGADNGTYLQHFVAAHGKTEWLNEVTDEEYNAKQ